MLFEIPADLLVHLLQQERIYRIDDGVRMRITGGPPAGARVTSASVCYPGDEGSVVAIVTNDDDTRGELGWERADPLPVDLDCDKPELTWVNEGRVLGLAFDGPATATRPTFVELRESSKHEGKGWHPIELADVGKLPRAAQRIIDGAEAQWRLAMWTSAQSRAPQATSGELRASELAPTDDRLCSERHVPGECDEDGPGELEGAEIRGIGMGWLEGLSDVETQSVASTCIRYADELLPCSCEAEAEAMPCDHQEGCAARYRAGVATGLCEAFTFHRRSGGDEPALTVRDVQDYLNTRLLEKSEQLRRIRKQTAVDVQDWMGAHGMLSAFEQALADLFGGSAGEKKGLSAGDRVFTTPGSRDLLGTVVDVVVGHVRRQAIVWDGTLTLPSTSGLRVNVGIVDEGDDSTFDGGYAFTRLDAPAALPPVDLEEWLERAHPSVRNALMRFLGIGAGPDGPQKRTFAHGSLLPESPEAPSDTLQHRAHLAALLVADMLACGVHDSDEHEALTNALHLLAPGVVPDPSTAPGIPHEALCVDDTCDECSERHVPGECDEDGPGELDGAEIRGIGMGWVEGLSEVETQSIASTSIRYADDPARPGPDTSAIVRRPRS